MVEFTLDKVNELLRHLKGLPKIKEISQLRKRLQKEKIKLVPKVVESAEKLAEQVAQVKASANLKRSLKQKRNWRYAKLIFDFVGDEFSLKEIRKEIAKKRKGETSRIPDAVFQNPSP